MQQAQKEARQQFRLSAVERDRRLSIAFNECFSTPAGKMVLDYLRTELVQRVMTPEVTDQALRYREGQRSVVGICDVRIKEGKHYARTVTA